MKLENLLAGAFLAAALFLVSCSQNNDANKVADAQKCLDDYASLGGNISDCEAKVAGLTTPEAYGIRCSVGFIREGKTTQNFIDAFASMATVSGASVQTFLSLMAFTSAGTGSAGNVNTNYGNAGTVYTNCAQSLAKGATMLSTFGYITNILFKYACDNAADCNMNAASVGVALAAAAVDAGASGTQLKSDLGVIVVNTNTVSCSTGSANAKLCEFMQTAISNAGGPDNKAAVGTQFIAVLINPPP